MIYIILVCLYAYLIIKVLFGIVPKAKELTKKVGPKLSIIEFFVIAIVLSYLFNYYYLQNSEFKNFIVPVDIIWLCFASSILLFGIAVGSRFILNLLENFIPNGLEANFARNKEVYDVFTLIWLDLSILMIFFSYSMMEISRPIERIDSLQNIEIVLGLSSLLGILFFFMHKEINALVKKVTVIGMALISICLVLFIYESRIDFLTYMPFTSSFIVFNITFFISLLVNLFFGFIRNRNNRKSVKGVAAAEEISFQDLSPNRGRQAQQTENLDDLYNQPNSFFNHYSDPQTSTSTYLSETNLLAKPDEIEISLYSHSQTPISKKIPPKETQSFEQALLGDEVYENNPNRFSLDNNKW